MSSMYIPITLVDTVSEFVIKPGAAIRIEQLATIWLWYTQQVDLTAEDIPTN